MNRSPDNCAPENDPKATPREITNEPGSNPVVTTEEAAGAGLGGAAGGLAGAAAGSLAGPIGAVVGAVVGVMVGGMAGKGIGEAINPSVEAAYWRENHIQQSGAGAHAYDNYADAYRVGYEGHGKYGATKKTFEDAEAELRSDYEASRASAAWPEARPATQAAWSRVEKMRQENGKA